MALRKLVIIAGEFREAADDTVMPGMMTNVRAYSDGDFVPIDDLPEGTHRALAQGAGSVLASGGAAVDIVTLCDPGAQLQKNWNPAHKNRLLTKSCRLLIRLLQSNEYQLAGLLWLGQAHSQDKTEAYQVMFGALIDQLRTSLGASQLPVSAMVQGEGTGDYTKGMKLSNFAHAAPAGKTNLTLADHAIALAKGLKEACADSPWAAERTLHWLWKGDRYEAWQSRQAGHDCDHYIVVFPHVMSGNGGFDVPAFGQENLEKRGAQLIFIRAKRSNWFQDDEVLELGAALRAAIPLDARITSYGASMGAYGALLLSGILRAERVVAVAPQYSLDRAVVPFERRWGAYRDRIGIFRHDLLAMIATDARKHVFYDNLDTDRRHIALLQPDESFHFYRFPGASHQILRYFLETDTIRDFLSALTDPDAEFDDMTQTARNNRQQSPIYWLSVFRRFKNTRPHCAAAALEHCIAIEGPKPKYTKRMDRLDLDGVIRGGANPNVDVKTVHWSYSPGSLSLPTKKEWVEHMPDNAAANSEDGRDEFIDIYRLKIRNDPKIITPRMYTVLKNGRYEETEAKLARRYLNPDDTLLEFGSGLGVIAAIAIKRAKVKKVVSVEANPDLHPIIRDTLANSGVRQDKCELIYGAVSVEPVDELTFYRRGDFWGSSLSPTPGKVVSTETVPCIDAAELIATHKPTVIFADIEGAELDVFPALDISSLRAVVMEIHPRVYGDKGVLAIFEAMRDKGFVYNKQSSGSVIVFQQM